MDNDDRRKRERATQGDLWSASMAVTAGDDEAAYLNSVLRGSDGDGRVVDDADTATETDERLRIRLEQQRNETADLEQAADDFDRMLRNAARRERYAQSIDGMFTALKMSVNEQKSASASETAAAEMAMEKH